MAPKPPLSDTEVLEILRLHELGMLAAEIAPKFQRAENTVRSILLGKSYRHVTGRNHRPGKGCDCLLCVIVNREEANLNVAEAATCLVHCLRCQKPMRLPVTTVLRTHGTLRCTSCDGRRR